MLDDPISEFTAQLPQCHNFYNIMSYIFISYMSNIRLDLTGKLVVLTNVNSKQVVALYKLFCVPYKDLC
jgi:hypothetical protein